MVSKKHPLSILLYTRADHSSNPGGDGVEAEALCKGLYEAGHHSVVATGEADYPGTWDIVHLFNIDRAPDLVVFLNRHDGFPGAKTVLTPVFSQNTKPASRFARNLLAVANLVRSTKRPSSSWIPGRAITDLAARIDGTVFHTSCEQQAFAQEHSAFNGPSTVVPPPVCWPELMGETPPLPFGSPFAANVGRIEPLKNQLWLLESGITEMLPLVFIGAPNPKRPRYHARFVHAVSSQPAARWLGRCSRATVRSVLAEASIHILPSRLENYGLATAEALSLGCEALVPRHHPIATELGGALHVFDFGNPESLLEATRNALSGPQRSARFPHARHDLSSVTSTVLDFYFEVLS